MSQKIAMASEPICCFSEGLAAVKFSNERYGYIDSKGNWTIHPKFQPYYAFLQGQHRKRIIRLNEEGDMKFKESLAPVRFRNNKIGFIDKSGVVIIKPIFEHARFFNDGLAAVVFEERMGFIKRDGNFAIKPHYSIISDRLSSRFDEPDDRPGSWRFAGGSAHYWDVRDFHCGRAPININGLWGYFDYAGKLAIKPEYQWACDFKEGIAAVLLEESFTDTKWIFINAQGKQTIKGKYKCINGFSEGVAPVSKDGKKWYFINQNGCPEFTGKYDYCESFSEGLAVIKKDGKYGYIERGHGVVIIQPIYEEAKDFKEGVAAVNNGHGYRFIDRTGKFVIDKSFLFAGLFSEGFAMVLPQTQGRWEFINRSGKTLQIRNK